MLVFLQSQKGLVRLHSARSGHCSSTEVKPLRPPMLVHYYIEPLQFQVT
jgi:hypothetical protein